MQFYVGPAGNCASANPPGTLGSFNRLVELGLNAQELEFVHSVFLTPEKAREVGAWARERGLRLSIHAPYYINLCSLERAKLAASRKRIADSLAIARELGAVGPVVVHPGFYLGRDGLECLESVVGVATELAREYPSALLGFETTGKHSAFGSLEEVIEVCKQAGRKNCVPVVDFAHLYARGAGAIDFGAVLDRLLECGQTNLYAHFSGIAFTAAGESRHLPLSSNAPPISGLLFALKTRASKFKEASIICESPLLEQDALVIKRELEKQGLWA